MSITDLKDRWQQTIEHACHLRHLAHEISATGREKQATRLHMRADKALHRADYLFSLIVAYEQAEEKVSENEDDT